MTAAQIAQQIRPLLLRFPGFRAFVSLPPSIQIGGRQSNSSYNLTVQSADTNDLYDWAARLEAAIAPLPEVQDVSDDLQMKSPRVNLVINRDTAAALGLSASDIEDRAVRRLRAAVVVDDLRVGGAVQSAARARPALPGARRLAREDRVQDVERQARAARVGADAAGDGRTADRESRRPAAGGVDFVRAAARRVARRGRRSHPPARPRACCRRR